MSFNRGTSLGPGLHRGEPLLKRTSDAVYLQVFWSPAPFRHNGVVVSQVASWIATDGTTYTAITEAQYEANYTPASSSHNLVGR